jgi:hypothetical protein
VVCSLECNCYELHVESRLIVCVASTLAYKKNEHFVFCFLWWKKENLKLKARCIKFCRRVTVVGWGGDTSLGQGICRSNPVELDPYTHLKLPQYRPGQLTGLQEVEAPRNYRHSAHQGG